MRARTTDVKFRDWPWHELAGGVTPTGFLRAWRGLACSTTNLQRDPDDPYDPADDMPFTVTEGQADDYWVRARKLAD